MYSEDDLRQAVKAGIVTEDAAEAFRLHVAKSRRSPAVDEEHFRLITGFNDIFVSIACLLVIFSVAFLTASLNLSVIGFLLVAAAAWGLAEAFTRRRRMALPSIILVVAFVTSIAVSAYVFLAALIPMHEVTHSWPHDPGETYTIQKHYDWQTSLIVLASGLVSTIAAFYHWRRFHVPVTIAAMVSALALSVTMLITFPFQKSGSDYNPLPLITFITGLAVFAYAMRWDFRDRERKTHRSDVAFWLHLAAAPLIAHSLFYWIGVLGFEKVSTGQALGVLALYAAMAIVALMIDRRALLVSALAYVIFALYSVVDTFGAVETGVGITTLIIGSALLAMSAFWQPLRRGILRHLPVEWQNKLPPTVAA